MIGDVEVRPWGSWQVVDEGGGFKVKRITVTPGSRLSYQYHEHRAEHWVVVRGRATCVVDGEIVVVETGKCIDIGVGVAHRIGNSEDTELVIIEVNRGSYLEEDDIIRLQDDFGRVED